jgi:two-component system cell cycle sensor histidine kinase/response regulator CckA
MLAPRDHRNHNRGTKTDARPPHTADSSRQPLRVLLLEHRPADAELVVNELRRAGFDPTWQRVEDENAFRLALDSAPDLILADLDMPALTAPRALELLRRQDADLPFIVVSSSIDEETAVEMLKSGATDYLRKDRLGRLGQAVKRAVIEQRLAQSKREADEVREATHARMGFALEASRVGTWESDYTTGAERWSETLEALHGMAPGAFRGTVDAFLECIYPEDRPEVEAAIARAKRERADSNILYRTMWPDGTLHWISSIGRTLFDDAGRPLRAAGIGLDVTERRSLEEKYRQAQKMEAVGQLAGGIAHDFNNLLTAIHGYAMLIAEELAADSPLLADLRQIRHSADRATSLTRQLLAFSRRQILDPHVLDLRESVKAIEPMLRRLIGEDIQFTVRSAADVGRVKADPGQIEQVIMNLVLNARDAMPRGGTLTIEVADAAVDKPAHCLEGAAGSCVSLAVSDTGEGIATATQPHIFEPFFTTKQKGKGTGLGLSTVYGIVTQSGGHVVVDSTVGHGSTFTVYLPRVDEPAEAVAAPHDPASIRGSETILVVEDEAAVRDLIQKALKRYGYQVLVASTPHEALEVASRAGRIHLLISDMVLPEMSGGDLASRMVTVQSGIRVLYMSGYTDHAALDGGVVEAGMSFLQKPFTPSALASKVREALG